MLGSRKTEARYLRFVLPPWKVTLINSHSLVFLLFFTRFLFFPPLIYNSHPQAEY